ncbi:unnamed protein product [Bursaphelenchus xylophilus]|uniref:(pine wood nematode) hypothetical protein n=1 Tax=Bursaphelenchus xylophilus TaxID=6326 RepID=A0A1I7S4X7_BURXY|nr:unnamed protein product [Bursaphelenchus xylophilus]CAG9117479.1 unnamed protein product [Bursaphelenchus xylophilus]
MFFTTYLLFILSISFVNALVNIKPDGVYFRAPHRKHIKMPYSCHDPEFCMHPTDNSTALDEMEWPARIKDYVHCMDLLCQCGAFNGTVKDFKCILPNGKVLHKALRKEFRQLTLEERLTYVEILNQLHREGTLNYIGLLHKTAGVHSGPAFFPWHREFFKRTELLIRTYNPEAAIPYWDSTLDNYLPQPYNSTLFTFELLGEPGIRGYVYDTVFTNWTTMDGRPTWYRSFGREPDGELINNNRIDYVMNQTDIHYVLAYSLPLIGCKNYTLDERFLEYSHDYVHYFISGDMQDRITSSNDPIFFLHHSFVDSIWEAWRQKKQTKEQRENDWPTDDLECAPAWHFKEAEMPLLKPFKNKDALSSKYTENLFEYAPRPSCLSKTEECGSIYLFCDPITTPSDPHCVAKVKLQGNCTGFEWSSDVCLHGKCIEGICKPIVDNIGDVIPNPFPKPPEFLVSAKEEIRGKKIEVKEEKKKEKEENNAVKEENSETKELKEEEKSQKSSNEELKIVRPKQKKIVTKTSRFM